MREIYAQEAREVRYLADILESEVFLTKSEISRICDFLRSHAQELTKKVEAP